VYDRETSPDNPDNLYADGAIEIHQRFPSEKLRRRDVSDYLEHAYGGGPVQSSLPPVLTRVERLTQTSERRLSNFSILGAVALAALLIGVFQVIEATLSVVHDARQEQNESVKAITGKIDGLTGRMSNLPGLEGAATTLQQNLEVLRRDIVDLATRGDLEQIQQRLREVEGRLDRLAPSRPSRPSPAPTSPQR